MSGEQMKEKDEVPEAEAFVKAHFHVSTWDGQNKQHEADVNASAKVVDLKWELRNELGDPALSDWIIPATQTTLSDGDTLLHKVEGGEVTINVKVHQLRAA